MGQETTNKDARVEHAVGHELPRGERRYKEISMPQERHGTDAHQQPRVRVVWSWDDRCEVARSDPVLVLKQEGLNQKTSVGDGLKRWQYK